MGSLKMPLVVSFLGAALHASLLSKTDLELFIFPFILGTVVSLVASVWALDLIWTSSTYSPAYSWFILVLSFFFGIFASMMAYRLWFHRLRKFPGPFLAKATRFYGLYLAFKETKYHNELEAMHSKYGDFIRVGPRELCIVRRNAIHAIHGPESDCQKSLWYSQFSTDTKKASVHTTRDFNNHRLRRRAWDQGFSVKALSMYEKRVQEQTELFLSKLSDGRVFNSTEWSMFFAFDTLGEIGFGRSFGCLLSGAHHPAIGKIHEHMETIGTVSQVPWLLYLISHIPGATAAYSEFFRLCEQAIDQKLENWDPDDTPRDIASWLLRAYIEKEKGAAPTKAALYEDSRVLIVAGSDTVAGVVAAALYYLAKNPSVQGKLQSEVDAMTDSPAGLARDKVLSIPYIDHIINETLRLKPPIMVGGPRVTPPGGIYVDEQYIPGDVNVVTPIRQLQIDHRYWQQALEFIPDRWGDQKKEMNTDEAPFFPFGLGPYSCPGKRILFMSLRAVLFRTTQQFDVVFAPGEDGEQFNTGAKETFSTTYPALMLRFVKRGNKTF